MSAFLDAYIKGFLLERGYQGVKPKYNISFSQGSGLSFSAHLTDSNINELAGRHLRGKVRFAAVRAYHAGFEFHLEANDDRYPHYRDIRKSFEYDRDAADHLMDVYDIDQLEVTAMFDLADAVEEEAQGLAYTVFRHCEDLLLAQVLDEETLMEKRIGNKIVRFSITADHNFFDVWDDYEFAKSLVELANDNDLMIGNLTVTVLDRETEEEIDSYSLGGYTTTKSNKDLRSDCLQILRDMRNQYQETAKAA
jgi:hypothetical protein